jgi:TRAP-type C4-dicarboxylate transport system permease small subunit
MMGADPSVQGDRARSLGHDAPRPAEGDSAANSERPASGLTARLEAAMAFTNRAVMVPCMLATLLAAVVLTYSVGARYFFKIPTEWQDETAIFLLIGATFFSSAFIQSRRGHVGVEAIAVLLPPRANWYRMLFVDVASFVFCTFFAWKSWTLFHEAFTEGYTSNSTWGPPLWIPYGLMALGMSLLALQILLQVASRLAARSPER